MTVDEMIEKLTELKKKGCGDWPVLDSENETYTIDDIIADDEGGWLMW